MVATAIFAGSSELSANPPAPLPNPARTKSPPPAKAAAATSVAKVESPPAADKVDAQPQFVKITGLTGAEAENVTRLDKAIEPLRQRELSPADAERIRDAVNAISSANLNKGMELRKEIQDPVGRKLVDWYRLRSGYGQAAEFAAFLDDNPAWPDRRLMRQRLEEALFTQGGSVSAIKAAFAKSAPQTGVGMAALASAHLVDGDQPGAKSLAAKAWREMDIPATLETGFLDRFGKLLTADDHKWRLDRLLIDDIRWSSERAARAAVIRRVIPLLPESEQKKAQARLAVFLGASGATAKVEALAPESKGDWGLTFQRIQALQRSKKSEEATALLLSSPVDAGKLVEPDGWWSMRRASAYDAMKANKYKKAYELVRDSGPLSINPLKEQHFLAGWIALRKLSDPRAAEPHFLAMRKAADGPISRSKADYWLGRTADERGDSKKALDYYRLAAEEKDTFHGFLARLKLPSSERRVVIDAPAAPTADEIERFNALDAVQAVSVARKSNLNASVLRAFITHLQYYMKSEAEIAMVLHLAEAVGDTQLAVRNAKASAARGHGVLYYSYPLHPFPSYRPLRKPPETALLLGIARQESEFNTGTVSGAGAKGLLQVMTITAKHVCADYKIKCEIDRLLTDKPYNAMIASAYIADRMDEFSGSYVLSLAGYNAGPGRARQWIKEFGDPRDPKVDPIDWIERIPFQETREYVAKVLSNIQVYRARLNGGTAPLSLADDLVRGRKGVEPPAPERTTREKPVANSDG